MCMHVRKKIRSQWRHFLHTPFTMRFTRLPRWRSYWFYGASEYTMAIKSSERGRVRQGRAYLQNKGERWCRCIFRWQLLPLSQVALLPQLRAVGLIRERIPQSILRSSSPKKICAVIKVLPVSIRDELILVPDRMYCGTVMSNNHNRSPYAKEHCCEL